jgi:hypothetical protein
MEMGFRHAVKLAYLKMGTYQHSGSIQVVQGQNP